MNIKEITHDRPVSYPDDRILLLLHCPDELPHNRADHEMRALAGPAMVERASAADVHPVPFSIDPGELFLGNAGNGIGICGSERSILPEREVLFGDNAVLFG